MREKCISCGKCATECPVRALEIAPYHELGISKSERLGNKAEKLFCVSEKEEIEKYILSLKKYTAVSVKRI